MAGEYATLGSLEGNAEPRARLAVEVTAAGPDPERPVTLVWLPDAAASDEAAMTRLLRETTLMRRIDHPGVVRVHGVLRFSEGWARICDYVDGVHLGRLLEAGAPEPAVAARIVLEVADAVHAAHEQGASSLAGRPHVHGALRPESILIGRDGRAAVSGFGAGALLPSTAHGVDRGDLVRYLAPEQILGGKATHAVATDVYALGGLLYTLLAGRPPYDGESDVENLVMTRPPAALDGDPLRTALGAVAVEAMAKRAADRPRSAKELASRLRSVLGEHDVVLPTEGELAGWVEAALPEDAPERGARRMLEDLEAGVLQPELHTMDDEAAPLARELVFAARPPSRRAPPREAVTDVGQAGPPGSPRRTEPRLSNGPVPKAPVEDAPTEAAAPIYRPPVPVAPSVASAPPAPSTVDVVRNPPNAPTPLPPPPVGYAYAVPLQLDPRTGQPLIVPAAPGYPAPTTGSHPVGAFAPPAPSASPAPASLQNVPVRNLPAAARRADPDSQISQFNRRAGDGSRSLLYIAVAAAFGLLAFLVFAPSDPAPEVDAAPATELTREEKREMLAQAFEESSAAEAEEADEVAAGETEGEGTLSVRTDPRVTVFLGDEKLGRTPLSTVVAAGRHRIRLTDAQTGINIYRSVRVPVDGKGELNETFGKAELMVTAPEGAKIYLNGRSIGKAPLAAPVEIFEGSYVLKVNYLGKIWAQRFKAETGRRATFDVHEN